MDRSGFDAFVREVADPLHRYLLRRTDPATADDVLGDALLVCWRRRGDIPAEALPWAFGVAKGCLRNAERAQRRRTRLELKLVAQPAPTEAPELDLSQALARLRPADAELIRLWAWEELPPQAIATVLGITANAASVRLHRAKRRLREELGKDRADAGHDGEQGGDR